MKENGYLYAFETKMGYAVLGSNIAGRAGS